MLRYISQTFVAASADGQTWQLSVTYGPHLNVIVLEFRLGKMTEGMDTAAGTRFNYMFEARETNRLTSIVTLEKEQKTGYRRVITDRVFSAGGMVQTVTFQGWKFMSCSRCQELGQQASWLLIGCTRGDNQSEARSAS